MKRFIAGACVILLLAVSAGCVYIRLPRVVDLAGETTKYTVTPDEPENMYAIAVRNLLMAGRADLAITPSDEPRVEVECPKALLDHGFYVTFDQDRLDIGTELPEVTFRGGEVKLHIYANYDSIRLEGAYDVYADGTGMRKIDLDVSGAVNCAMENLDADTLSIDLSGAGKIRLSGSANALDVDISGAAQVEAKPLTAVSAEAEISGAGSMTLTVTGSLDAGISGTGKIVYYGDPQHVSPRVSGAGSVKPGE